jgi:hypothetical protein
VINYDLVLNKSGLLFFQHDVIQFSNAKSVSSGQKFITEGFELMQCITVVGNIPRKKAQYQ